MVDKTSSHSEIPSDSAPRKYAKSGLRSKEASEISEKIISVLENDKLFKDSSLSLAGLCDYIGKDRYKVSQVINENLKTNFYSLLNSYRIKEAQDLLQTQPSLSVKAVMYEVGFNSKTSFYGAFKKKTGLTPNDYRNNAKYS